MSVSVDHLVFGARSLAEGIADLEARLGVRAVAGGRHAAWGTHNALLGLGRDCYLEVLAPDPDAAPPRQAPLGLAALAAPRLVTWAVRTHDIETLAARLRALGIDPGAIGAGGRVATDGTRLVWRLTDLAAPRLGGVVPFLIDWGATPHPAETLPPAGELLELRLRHPEPGRVRAALATIGIDTAVTASVAPAIAATLRTPSGDVTLGG